MESDERKRALTTDLILILLTATAGISLHIYRHSRVAKPFAPQLPTAQSTRPDVSFAEQLLATVGDSPDPRYSVAFHPQGNKAAYVVDLSFDRSLLMIGDRKGPEFEGIFYPVYSADGSTLAFVASKNPGSLATSGSYAQSSFLVIGDQRRPRFRAVYVPALNVNGTKFAYRAETQREPTSELIMFGDQNVEEIIRPESSRSLSDPAISPDGSRVAYFVREPYSLASTLVIVDDNGQRYAERFNEYCSDLVISRAGIVAYKVTERDRQYVMVGGQYGPEFDLVSAPLFSPAGTRIAFAGGHKDNAGDKVTWSLIIMDLNKEPEFNPRIWRPVLISATGRVVYEAKIGGSGHLAIAGQRTSCGETQGMKGVMTPVAFSPDNNRVVLMEEREKEYSLVVGDRRSPWASYISTPVFSSDGRKLAYGAVIKGQLWWRVLELLP